jgi:hypothetical protein
MRKVFACALLLLTLLVPTAIDYALVCQPVVADPIHPEYILDAEHCFN